MLLIDFIDLKLITYSGLNILYCWVRTCTERKKPSGTSLKRYIGLPLVTLLQIHSFSFTCTYYVFPKGSTHSQSFSSPYLLLMTAKENDFLITSCMRHRRVVIIVTARGGGEIAEHCNMMVVPRHSSHIQIKNERKKFI